MANAVGLGLGGYVLLALALDAAAGIWQPSLEPGDAEGVLRTLDADGTSHENRMIVIEDGDTLWVQSGHHFRGWYHRLERNPEVELVRGGEVRTYTAVPVPEARDRIVKLLKRRVGTAGYYGIRVLLLFADVKPVRLDPR